MSCQGGFGKPTPAMKAQFLRGADFISTTDLRAMSCQGGFDAFYESLQHNLNVFFPMKTVRIASRDPPYVTPAVKLMRQGQTNAKEENYGSKCTSHANWSKYH